MFLWFVMKLSYDDQNLPNALKFFIELFIAIKKK